MCATTSAKAVTPRGHAELATPWGSGGRRPNWRKRQLFGPCATCRHPWTV